ncbi:MAG: hypothetical protein NXI19_01640 [Alphaproteobacteria bacterium]|nr:hypothetical protein [Alphaproteobacteria bacterium]
MKAFATLILMVGLMFGVTGGAMAQSVTVETPAVTSDSSSGGGTILTPEQIESLSTMVDQMRSKMNEMVDAAQDAASQMSDGSKVVMVSTNDLVVIAIGSLGGALVIDLLGGGGMATLAGAVAGGIGAHWFMTQPMPIIETPTSG